VTTARAERGRSAAAARSGPRLEPGVPSLKPISCAPQVRAWMKTVGRLRTLHHRGGERVDWAFTFTAALYNVGRLRTRLAGTA